MLFAEPLLSQYCEPEQNDTNISPITYTNIQPITIQQAVPVAVVPSGTISAIEYVQPNGQPVTNTFTTLSTAKGSKFESEVVSSPEIQKNQ